MLTGYTQRVQLISEVIGGRLQTDGPLAWAAAAVRSRCRTCREARRYSSVNSRSRLLLNNARSLALQSLSLIPVHTVQTPALCWVRYIRTVFQIQIDGQKCISDTVT